MSMNYLNLAAELAEKMDWRDVYPNPRVGCVIVRDGEILSTGVHEKRGEAHAEVSALNEFELYKKRTGQSSNSGLEVYVTLEPCDHFPGKKTGSCTKGILHLKPKKVIIGAIDPMFGGKNMEKLRTAGIEVELVEHERSKALSRKKPHVILKMAQTLDGFITPPGILENPCPPLTSRGGKYISSLESRKKVHQWRLEADGILTTTKTILVDDPLLDCRLLNKNVTQDLFVFGSSDIPDSSKIFQFPDRKVFRFEGKDLSHDLREISEMGIGFLLTECGSHMATSLLQQDLVDEIRLFVAPKIFGKGVAVFANEIDLGKFIMTDVEVVGGDVLVRFLRKKGKVAFYEGHSLQ